MPQESKNEDSGTISSRDNVNEKSSSVRNNHTAEIIQAWVVARLAEEWKLQPVDIDTQLPLTSYGLDSLTAFTLTGHLADWLGHALPATLFFDHPTIEGLTQHLAEQIAGWESATRNLLAEIEKLPEEETQRQRVDKKEQ